MKTQPLMTPFEELLESCYQTSMPSPIRAKAWDKLIQKGLPDKRFEAFTYVPMRHLYQASYEISKSSAITKEDLSPFIMEECRHSVIVFIDGVYSSELSCLPTDITVMPISKAEKGSYGGFLQKRSQERLEKETDPFVLMNLALHDEGVFFFLPPKKELQSPIQSLCVTTKQGSIFQPRIQIVIGAHAKMSWITSYAHLGENQHFFQNTVMDISLEDESVFDHTLYMNTPKQSWNFFALRASLKKASSLECKNFSPGAKGSRQDYYITLLGEESDAKISGLTWTAHHYQSHAHVTVDHCAPNCTSNQFFKGVLSGSSHTSFTGKIMVRKLAQKTLAYQLNNSLLLEEGAIAYSKPGLEIFADDVKASHGATVSQLNEDQLFYLKTRGLSDGMAKNLLVAGFCRDIIEKVPIDSLKTAMITSIENYIREYNP